MLSALRAGKSVTAAIELALRNSSMPQFNRAGYVRHCFETWAAMCWLCKPRGGQTENRERKGVN